MFRRFPKTIIISFLTIAIFILILTGVLFLGEYSQERNSDVVVTPSEDTLVKKAKEDLAKSANLPKEKITVRSFRNVTWSDSSLGCPKEGESYLLVIMEGAQIILEAEGKIYHYHSGPERKPFFCEKPASPLNTTNL